jgi:hypothetical protein
LPTYTFDILQGTLSLSRFFFRKNGAHSIKSPLPETPNPGPQGLRSGRFGPRAAKKNRHFCAFLFIGARLFSGYKPFFRHCQFVFNPRPACIPGLPSLVACWVFAAFLPWLADYGKQSLQLACEWHLQLFVKVSLVDLEAFLSMNAPAEFRKRGQAFALFYPLFLGGMRLFFGFRLFASQALSRFFFSQKKRSHSIKSPLPETPKSGVTGTSGRPLWPQSSERQKNGGRRAGFVGNSLLSHTSPCVLGGMRFFASPCCASQPGTLGTQVWF